METILIKFVTNKLCVNVKNTHTCWNEVSFSVCGPRSIIWCNGSKTLNIPLTFLSPKYNLEASSNPSAHNSCHKIATRINSSLTINACFTKVELCSHKLFRIWLAALCRSTLFDLDDTVNGYIRAYMKKDKCPLY